MVPQRASEESLASVSSMEETRSVMSFILSRVPEHGSIAAAASAPPLPGPSIGGAMSSTTTSSMLAHAAPCGDSVALALSPPMPVAVRERSFPKAAIIACLPSLLKLLLLLFAHVVVIIAFVDHGWDAKEPWCKGAGLLLVLMAVLDASLLGTVCLGRCGRPANRVAAFAGRAREQIATVTDRKGFFRTFWTLVWVAVLLFLAVDSKLHPDRVVAAVGMVVLFGFGYIFSNNRSKIKWRPVLGGLLLQFLLGLLLVRAHVGRGALLCIADKIAAIMSFAGHGSRFVFGYLATGKLDGGLPEQKPVLAFTVASAVVFSGLLVSALCHYGLLQRVMLRVGRLMEFTLGTTSCESLCAASNVILGMTDSAQLIKPYLAKLTKSELHCVMTCGFATISGSLFAVFTAFGVKAEHMMAASLMSAPAALAFAKLLYPETEENTCSPEKIKQLQSLERGSLLESMARGMTSLVMLVANVVGCLLGFVAFMALADAVLVYLGTLLRWEFLTVDWLMGRLFIPLALAMGVSLEECSRVASLVGLKTALNEVVAYGQLSDLVQRGLLSPRAEMVCTFALCGFSNLGALGVQLGACAALVPDRLPDCSRVVMRALIAGWVACFMTACTAGALTDTRAYEVLTRFKSYEFL
ncbi:putative transporter YutK [Haemaphysalis longicornis]